MLNDMVRAQAAYLIAFEGVAHESHAAIGRKVADVIAALGPVEIRVSADSGSLSAYVCIPLDVLPEALDRKADELRRQWIADGVK